MIDRITDAGQCDYEEVVIKVIKQGLSNNCLKQMRYRFTVKGRKKYRVLLTTSDYRLPNSTD